MRVVSEPERSESWPDEEPRSEPVSEPPAAEAARILEQALAQVESLLGKVDQREQPTAPAKEKQAMASQELTDLRRTLREVVHRLEDALDHLGMEAQRLSDETSRVALVADHLEARLLALARSLRQSVPPPVAEPTPEEELAVPQEPQFQPGDHAVGIVVAAVPGFQELMDMQRGLSRLQAVDGASVSSYRDGEASLELVLREPVSARQIVEQLGESTKRQLLIEEARPEAQRLRLRFVNQEDHGFGENQRPEPRPGT